MQQQFIDKQIVIQRIYIYSLLIRHQTNTAKCTYCGYCWGQWGRPIRAGVEISIYILSLIYYGQR